MRYNLQVFMENHVQYYPSDLSFHTGYRKTMLTSQKYSDPLSDSILRKSLHQHNKIPVLAISYKTIYKGDRKRFRRVHLRCAQSEAIITEEVDPYSFPRGDC